MNDKHPLEIVLNKLQTQSVQCLCKHCKEPMVGYDGDDECSDCAFPLLKKASENAARRVEEGHFERTGERKTAGELFRRTLGM